MGFNVYQKLLESPVAALVKWKQLPLPTQLLSLITLYIKLHISCKSDMMFWTWSEIKLTRVTEHTCEGVPSSSEQYSSVTTSFTTVWIQSWGRSSPLWSHLSIWSLSPAHVGWKLGIHRFQGTDTIHSLTLTTRGNMESPISRNMHVFGRWMKPEHQASTDHARTGINSIFIDPLYIHLLWNTRQMGLNNLLQPTTVYPKKLIFFSFTTMILFRVQQ